MSDPTDLAVLAPAADDQQDKPEPITRWVWRAMEPGDRETRLMELTGWVDVWLIKAHPKIHRKIPRCWHQHEDIIEYLTALFLGWVRTYAGDPAKLSTRAEIEWVSALHSLAPHLSSPGCEASNVHKPDPTRPKPDGEALEQWMDTEPEFLTAPAHHPAQAEVSRMVAAARAAEAAKAQG
ncbi:hypothetical protein P1P68_05980 [Streptomyces scabiei]|uniref:hypothetical protein n=1 Tax=Streptomyces scabiei TaxID=1930 RepID=UPI00298FB6C0|nr:hypothetical protein [Streptomyces scabiei]MDW8804351.1 hypothetical protein [Streptomyces scabiei]